MIRILALLLTSSGDLEKVLSYNTRIIRTHKEEEVIITYRILL